MQKYHSDYQGYTIDRITHNGMYVSSSTDYKDRFTLMADTLSGIHQLICESTGLPFDEDYIYNEDL